MSKTYDQVVERLNAEERALLDATVGKAIARVEDEIDCDARTGISLHFTDGTVLRLSSCTCCDGIGVQ